LPTTVFIADDHDLTVRGTEAAIRAISGFEVVGTATSGIAAIAAIRRLKPDCAVLDLSMPGASGLEVLIEARRWSPKTRVLVITGNAQPSVLAQLVESGANGVFLKSGPLEEFCEGLRRVAAGGRAIGDDVARLVEPVQANNGLTRREIEVLNCVARGLSNAQIGGHLGVSAKTVDSHRTSLMRKFGVHSTATLLVRAMREGLIDVNEP